MQFYFIFLIHFFLFLLHLDSVDENPDLLRDQVAFRRSDTAEFFHINT